MGSVGRRLAGGETVRTTFGVARCRRFGQGRSERVLVLVDGIGSDSSYWPEIVEELAQSQEGIAVDLFGRGGCDAGGGPYSADDFAQLVEEVLAAVGLEARPVLLCGFSFGAAVAAQLASRAKLIVEGALLLVPAGIALEPTAAAGIRLMRRTPRGVSDALSTTAQCGSMLFFGCAACRRPPAEVREVDGYRARKLRVVKYSLQDFCLNPSFFRAYMHTLRDFPLGSDELHLRDSYRKLTALGSNLGIVVASKDSVIASAAVSDFVREQLPKACLVELDGGHEVQWDRPREMCKIILEFSAKLCEGTHETSQSQNEGANRMLGA